jgi:hypothetical protein
VAGSPRRGPAAPVRGQTLDWSFAILRTKPLTWRSRSSRRIVIEERERERERVIRKH